MQRQSTRTAPAPSRPARRVLVAARIGVITAAIGVLAPTTVGASPIIAAPSPAVSPEDVAGPSISASAGSVVFTATASDGRRSAFHLDRSDGEITDLVTVADSRRSGDTVAATLSDDGCVVVAISQIGFDIFRDDDTGRRWDVYRLVLPHCDGRPNDWQLISSDSRGIARDDIDPVQRLSISSDGTIIALTAPDDATDDDLNAVTIVDVTKPIGSDGRNTVVPGRPASSPTRPFHYRGADEPALSAAGDKVAFRADFDPRSKTWNEGPIEGEQSSTRVFVWDRSIEAPDPSAGSTDAENRAWLAPTGPVDGEVESEDTGENQSQPSLSADGSTLAFVAPIPQCSGRCPTQIYRWPVGADTPPELVSAQPWPDPSIAGGALPDTPSDDTSSDDGTGDAADTSPVPGDGDSRSPTLNANGTMIAFVTSAANLTIARPNRGGGPDVGTVMVAGTVAGANGEQRYLAPATRPAIDDDSGDDATVTPISGTDGYPDLSATGTTAVFDSEAVAVSGSNAPEVPAVGRQLAFAVNPSRTDTAQLDFGSVQAGQQSAEFYTTVRNQGPSSIQPTAVYTDNDQFEVQGGTCAARVIIAPGQSCTVRLTFTPAGGRASAELIVDDGLGTIARTELSGQAGDPRLRIDPAGVDLGRAVVDEEQVGEGVLTVTNVALDATEVGGVSLAGRHLDDFTIVGDECSGTVLAPEQGCVVKVSFSPSDSGYRSATLIAQSTSGDTAAAIIGGQADRVPRLDAVVAAAEPGARVALTGSGFEPGSAVWSGIVGERGVTGPFVVDDDGSVAAWVAVPIYGNDKVATIALQGETTAVLSATIAVNRDATPTPSYLPGYGYG